MTRVLLLANVNETQAVERMRQVIRRKHKALATEDAYVLMASPLLLQTVRNHAGYPANLIARMLQGLEAIGSWPCP